MKVPKLASDSPFTVPLFRVIWASSLMTQLGSQIQAVGAAWMMTSMQASPQMIALVQTSVMLPMVLLSLPAGALADAVDRRRIMMTAQVFMITVSVILTVLTALGALTPWLLLGFTFLIACGNAFNAPSWQASVGDIVPRALLPNAVAMNSMGFNMTRSVGPAIGGALVAFFGAASAFMANALGYIPLFIAFSRWKPERPERRGPPEQMRYAMTAGLRYVSMSPVILRLMLRGTLFTLGGASVMALLPVVARDLLGGGPLVFGALSGAFGVGAVGGAFSGGRLRRRFPTEIIMRMAAACIAAGAAIAAVSHQQIFTMIGLTAAGAGWVTGLSTSNVVLQMASPRWVVGRAISVFSMALAGGMALGSWGFGVVAQHQGVQFALLAAAGWQVVSLLIGFVLPFPAIEALDLDPLGRWTEPQTEVPVEPRSGPVFVTVAYSIPEDRLDAFATAMTERRRIRRRDGAQDWRLARDLAHPDIWLEMYRTATWADYVRHNERRTNADLQNTEVLHDLHAGDAPPAVTRLLERPSLGAVSPNAPQPAALIVGET